jgi:hypothetical protein
MTSVFTELFGLPAHALIVHAAVVFIPLAAVFGIVYAVAPVTRKYIWWAVLGLGVAAPVTGWAARLSGGKYKEYWVANGASGQFLDDINKHQSFGEPTAWWATALGVVLLAMVLYAIPGPVSLAPKGTAVPAAVRLVTVVVVVAVSLVTLYYIIRTGDAGAHASHVEI